MHVCMYVCIYICKCVYMYVCKVKEIVHLKCRAIYA